MGLDQAGVALLLSRQLIAAVKLKNVLHIEAGLQMIALAMAFSSEVSNMDGFNGVLIYFIFIRTVASFRKLPTTLKPSYRGLNSTPILVRLLNIIKNLARSDGTGSIGGNLQQRSSLT